MNHTARFLVAPLLIALLPAAVLAADSIDLTAPITPPISGQLKIGGKNPQGDEIGANSRFLTLNGTPWFPVMGEFHYSRYPADEWENELLKMKAGGVNTVSTYIFWIHHEEVEGQFDWAGDKDLRRFVQLCAKHGLNVFLRIGPWDHGEARSGGFPDWLVEKSPVLRREDPVFMGYVHTLYQQIFQQVSGLLWKDGGPIIGIQVENEYHGNPSYLLALKKMARDIGFDVPLYTVTGWDRARYPADEFLPVFGGYADGFWFNDPGFSRAARKQFFFTAMRDDASYDDNFRLVRGAPPLSILDSYPFLDAEIGGGMTISYARRPLLTTNDVVATALCKLGSGSNLLGYYLYHGSRNPDHKLGNTLQESQSTKVTNDNDMMPINYDFQAPLGEYGQERPTYGALRLLHAFVTDFGGDLAPMPAFYPAEMPKNTADAGPLRWTVRTDGHRGFIFISNYQRDISLPQRQVQLDLKLADGTQTVPATGGAGVGVAIPSGSYMIWPFNLDLGGPVLKYATAQPLCRLDGSGPPVFVFFAPDGVAPELAFDSKTVVSINGPLGSRQDQDGQIVLRQLTPGANCLITVASADGKTAKVLVLTQEQATRSLKANIGGTERLLQTPDDLIVDGDSVQLQTREAGFSLAIYPPPAGALTGMTAATDGVFSDYSAQAAAKPVDVHADVVKAAGVVPPVKLGVKHKPIPPDDAAYDNIAAVWHIAIPPDALADDANAFLRINYAGDTARAYIGDKWIDDQFYFGPQWEIGLKRFAPDVLAQGITLKVMPLRADDPVNIQPEFRPAMGADGQAIELRGVEIQRQYEMKVEVGR
jgi:beta-galactosidase